MLIYAIESKTSEELIRWLIDHMKLIHRQSSYPSVIHVDVQDKYNKTALMYAMEVGFYDTANYLIDRGADIELRDNAKQSALLYAITFKAPKSIIEKLVIQSYTFPFW